MITRKPLKAAPAAPSGNGKAAAAKAAKGKAAKAVRGTAANGSTGAGTGAPRVRVTFSLPDEGTAVSVVGDFNGWDPLAHPLRRRSNGTRSVAVELEAGRSYAFRYLVDGGHFLDDPAADSHEANGYGGTHSVLSC